MGFSRNVFFPEHLGFIAYRIKGSGLVCDRNTVGEMHGLIFMFS